MLIWVSKLMWDFTESKNQSYYVQWTKDIVQRTFYIYMLSIIQWPLCIVTINSSYSTISISHCSMDNIDNGHCTLYSGHSTLVNGHWTMYNVQCTMYKYIVHCTRHFTLYNGHRTLYNRYFRLYNGNCSLYNGHCSLYNGHLHCTLDIVHCTLYCDICTLIFAHCTLVFIFYFNLCTLGLNFGKNCLVWFTKFGFCTLESLLVRWPATLATLFLMLCVV